MLDGSEGGDNFRIKMRSALAKDYPARRWMAQRLLVAPIRCKRVVDVGQGKDARRQRYALSLETVGISAAVPFLMVGPGYINAHPQELIVRVSLLHRGERIGAQSAMLLHHGEFFLSQFSGFQEDRVRGTDLTDIVQGRRLVQGVDESQRQLRRVHPHRIHLFRQRPAEGLNPFYVQSGVGVTRLGDLGQREDGSQL